MITFELHFNEKKAVAEILPEAPTDAVVSLARKAVAREKVTLEGILGDITSNLKTMIRKNLKTGIGYLSPNAEHFYGNDVILGKVIFQCELIVQNLGLLNNQKVNQQVIAALESLRAHGTYTPFEVVRILAQFRIPGVTAIDFTFNETKHQQQLSEMCFPENKVPNSIRCDITEMVMDDPLPMTLTAWIDGSIKGRLTSNPYTREALEQDLVVDPTKQKEIALFMQKVEWVYCRYNGARRYQEAYAQETVLIALEDSTKSFDDFCQKVEKLMKSYCWTDGKEAVSHMPGQFMLYTKGPETPQAIIPPKYILDIFTACMMQVLRPTVEDYQLAVRRLCASGRAETLGVLLASPCTKLMELDVYAPGLSGKNSLDLLNGLVQMRPDKAGDSEKCREILAAYQAPPAMDASTTATPA